MLKCKYFRNGKVTITDRYNNSLTWEDDGKGVNEDELALINGVVESRYTVVRIFEDPKVDEVAEDILFAYQGIIAKLNLFDVAGLHKTGNGANVLFLTLPPSHKRAAELFKVTATVVDNKNQTITIINS